MTAKLGIKTALNRTFLSPGVKYKKSGRPKIYSYLELQNEEKRFVICQTANEKFYFFWLKTIFWEKRWISLDIVF